MEHLPRGEECCTLVDNDEGGSWTNPDKAAHFVCGVKEGSVEVCWIVEKDNLPLVVCSEEETVHLVERGQFFFEGGFKVHQAGETRDVMIP